MEAMMTDVRRSISFGLKTSQQGFAYDEILALWRATGDPGVVDLARRAGRADHTPAPRCDRDQQPFAATDRAGEDGRHRRFSSHTRLSSLAPAARKVPCASLRSMAASGTA